MSEPALASTPPQPRSQGSFRVLIVGGGVAGWEAAFALRELAGDRVSVTMLTAADDFYYRPLSIGEPFSRSHARSYPQTALAALAGAELVRDRLLAVLVDERSVHCESGARLPYDALLIAVGASFRPLSAHATPFDDARIDELLHGLVQDIEEGYLHRLAIVVPAPPPWPLPAYELALMAAERAWDMQTELAVTLLTPERAPLEVFGDAVSRGVGALLAQRRVEVVTSAYCEIPRSGQVIVSPIGRTLEAERVIALPRLSGPELDGLPRDGGGFLPVDQFACVRGTEHVWAAGDGTDTPVRHGGIAAQLADTAARSIAIAAGAALSAKSFVPVIEGVLMTGDGLRYLRGDPAWPGARGESVFSRLTPAARPPKIAARHLEPALERLADAAAGA